MCDRCWVCCSRLIEEQRLAQVEEERKAHEVLEKQEMEERARREAEEEVAALAEILELELEEMMGVSRW